MTDSNPPPHSRRTNSRSLSPTRSASHTDPFVNEYVEADNEEQYQRVIAAVFPSCTAVAFEIFKEGVTNRLVKCTCSNGRVVLIRIYGRKSELIIDRLAELSNLKTLAMCGLATPVYGKFRNGLVYGFVEGSALKTHEVAEHIQGIAEKLRDWHCRVPVFDEPVLFHTLNKWYDGLPEAFHDPAKQGVYQSFDLDYLQAAIDWLETNLPDSPTVFCHNDLLAANIVSTAGSSKAAEDGRVQFIDFEYANPNPRAYDLANHLCEWAGLECDWSRLPSTEQRRQFYAAYLGTSDEAEIALVEKEVQAYEPAPHLVWTLWAILQAQYSEIDFDYMEYGRRRYERLRALLPI